MFYILLFSHKESVLFFKYVLTQNHPGSRDFGGSPEKFRDLGQKMTLFEIT